MATLGDLGSLPKELEDQVLEFEAVPFFPVVRELTYCYHGSGNPAPDINFWVFDDWKELHDADLDTFALCSGRLPPDADDGDVFVTEIYLEVNTRGEIKDPDIVIDYDSPHVDRHVESVKTQLQELERKAPLPKTNWAEMVVVNRGNKWFLDTHIIGEVGLARQFPLDFNKKSHLLRGFDYHNKDALPYRPHHMWGGQPDEF
ncbi:MAG: hypothetical protein ACXABY_17825 [Candidatus Thorarchaeota archaeon]|jgi:hypothetical protein